MNAQATHWLSKDTDTWHTDSVGLRRTAWIRCEENEDDEDEEEEEEEEDEEKEDEEEEEEESDLEGEGVVFNRCMDLCSMR